MTVGREVLPVSRPCRFSTLSPSLFGTKRVTIWPGRERGAIMIGDFDCSHSSDLPIPPSSSPPRATRPRPARPPPARPRGRGGGEKGGRARAAPGGGGGEPIARDTGRRASE